MAREVYRRSPHLVCYWWGGELVVENYVNRTRVAATPLTCELLHFFDRWLPASAVAKPFPAYQEDFLARALTDLARLGLLERSRTPRRRNADALATWKDWSPAASFFHFTTKDGHAPIEPEDSWRELKERARSKPIPSPIKRYAKNRKVFLPPARTTGDLPRVLLERQTWRRFSRQPLELQKLATLLGLSFGVQSWLEVRGLGRVALKTSPSGGARHPIEAYVLALRVRGLPRGLYHYDAGGHQLELLRRSASPKQLVRYLNGQWWFGGASALVLMTAVFARTQWKYPAPRAYRVVLIDAGHLCQTFCLVATWLGLAPFCTMALADSRIEQDLGIDGVTESILYTAGVGTRPRTTKSARWPSRPLGHEVPNLSR